MHVCYIPYHRSNSISSLLKTLCRHIADHHTLPVIHSLFLSDNSRPGPSPLAPYYILLYVKTPLPYLYSPNISDYSHAQSRYHMFSFPCHTFVLLFHMLLFIIPHAISKSSTCSLPFITCHVSSLQYISFEYPSCISPVSNINSSSPLLSHFTSEVQSLHPESRAHR